MRPEKSVAVDGRIPGIPSVIGSSGSVLAVFFVHEKHQRTNKMSTTHSRVSKQVPIKTISGVTENPIVVVVGWVFKRLPCSSHSPKLHL